MEWGKYKKDMKLRVMCSLKHKHIIPCYARIDLKESKPKKWIVCWGCGKKYRAGQVPMGHVKKELEKYIWDQ